MLRAAELVRVVLEEGWAVQRPRGGRCEKGQQLFSLARIKLL